MYSRPTSATFAALTMASAASTAPTKPLVSIMPSASIFIRDPPPTTVLLSLSVSFWREILLAHGEIQSNKTAQSRQGRQEVGCCQWFGADLKIWQLRIQPQAGVLRFVSGRDLGHSGSSRAFSVA